MSTKNTLPPGRTTAQIRQDIEDELVALVALMKAREVELHEAVVKAYGLGAKMQCILDAEDVRLVADNLVPHTEHAKLARKPSKSRRQPRKGAKE